MFGCTFALALASSPPLATNCSIEGQTCGIGQDNLLTSYAGVESLQECEALCIDNLDCEFITHFGPDSFPLRNYCKLFSECGNLTDCQGCITAVEICFEQCGQNLEGLLEENVLEIIPGVEDELSCKACCRNEPDCSAYTYHDNSDLVLPGICFILTAIQGPLQPCKHCSTGYPDCRNITGGYCTFSVEAQETALTSYQFTGISNTTVSINLALGNCELTVVAVGGGGDHSGGFTSYGAGGSGYVASTSLMPSPLSRFVVRVGGPGELSSLETSEGQTVITAQPGKDGSNYNGGAGYSGGGAGTSNNFYPSGDGGEDGGDGDDGYAGYPGGRGSGLDISTIQLQQFSLTPGRGGVHLFGGGGGGIMVDGSGPQASENAGQGYGGGGAYGGGDNPGPGLVLLEMKPKQ